LTAQQKRKPQEAFRATGEESKKMSNPTVQTLTSSQKGKHTKAMKQFVGYSEAELVTISEMVCLFILAGEKIEVTAIAEEMTKRARVEVAASEPEEKRVSIARVGMTLGEAIEKAQEFLGSDAVVWTSNHDHKGREFTATRVYVGIPTDKPNGYIVSEGRLMIGTGVSFAGAVNDARKRVAAAATDKAPAAKKSDIAVPQVVA
jgi:hypothetical protein